MTVRPASQASSHLGPEKLRQFLLGKLDCQDTHAVVRHLFHCEKCRAVCSPIGEVLMRPGRASRQPSDSDGSEYDFAIARAYNGMFRELRRLAEKRDAGAGAGRPPTPQELLEALIPPREPGGEAAWQGCEALLGESWALRYDDPEGMLCFAAAAVALAQGIAPATRGPQQLADLLAKAHAALGNARRVAEDLLNAEADFTRARECAARGTGDPRLVARLLDLAASLYIHQSRYGEARQLLAWSARLYLREGDERQGGKVLLQRAMVADYLGDPHEGLRAYTAALPLIDPESDPEALFACVHGLAWSQAECGLFEDASAVLRKAATLCATFGSALDRVRLRWLEARIAAGQCHFGRAERWFREVRERFLAYKLPYTAAVVALDLAILLLERGRTEEARTLVSETLATFRILQVHPDAAMAVVLLGEIIRQDCLSIAFLRSAAADLRKVER